MDQAILSRILVAAAILTGLSISIYFRRTAQKGSQDKINRRQEGKITMFMLRIGGLMIWLSVISYILYPAAVSWSLITVPSWVLWIGAAASAVSVILLVWMFTSLGKNITDSVSIREEHSLVTSGPYRYIRHPLYVFGALLFFSISVIMGSWFIPLIGIPTYAILIYRTGIEEEMLTERFGEKYTQYIERTGRFFPRLG